MAKYPDKVSTRLRSQRQQAPGEFDLAEAIAAAVKGSRHERECFRINSPILEDKYPQLTRREGYGLMRTNIRGTPPGAWAGAGLGKPSGSRKGGEVGRMLRHAAIAVALTRRESVLSVLGHPVRFAGRLLSGALQRVVRADLAGRAASAAGTQRAAGAGGRSWRIRGG